MREIRSSGSVEGVLSDGHSYSDGRAESVPRRISQGRGLSSGRRGSLDAQ